MEEMVNEPGAMVPQPGPLAGPTGPATIAPQSGGLVMRGKALGNLSLFFLVKALQFLPPTTEEGQTVAEAIKKLGKAFSDEAGDVERQEMKLAMQGAPPVQSPSPQQGDAWRQMVASRMPAGVGSPQG